MSISQDRNDGRSCNAVDLSMTYIETSLAIMTSTTTGFNWTATHPKCLSGNIDVISRFQLSKISSQVIVVCSPVLNNATICPLQGSWQVNAGGTRHADQTWFVRDLSLKWEREKKPRSCENFSLRKYLTAEISILNQCLISLAKQTHFTTRKLAVLYTRPSISGLEQSVPRRAPSTSGSF